jgi:hypothetical protein
MGSGSSTKIETHPESKEEETNLGIFNVHKIKSIDCYIGSRKFSEISLKKYGAITRMSSGASLNDKRMLIKSTTMPFIEENDDLGLAKSKSHHPS